MRRSSSSGELNACNWLKTSGTALRWRMCLHLCQTRSATNCVDARIGSCSTRLQAAPGNRSNSGPGASMIDRIIYTSEADADVAEAYGWYESREPGLGEDFLRCVEACVLTVQRHPHLYSVAVDNFRRALV